jgi:endonuclease/exonuclease/phosphatase family metal-dependent hydrolase
MLEHGLVPRAPRAGRTSWTSRPRLAGLCAAVLTLSLTLLTPLATPASGDAGDEPPVAPTPATPFKVKVGSFNILGSQHTARPGGFEPGRVRASYTAQLVHDKKIDVIGMQEVQWDQLQVLGRELDDYWIWPYKRLGKAQGLRLQIAYKRDRYEFVEGRKVYTRFDGNTRPIPYVRLRDKTSGQEFWFLTFHNSRHMAERNGATARLVDLVNELRGTGVPVVLGGDSNTWYDFACRMGRFAAMDNAAGGRLYPCRPPGNPVFDVLMANPRVELGRYRQLGGREVWRASDHKLLTAKVRLAPEEG